MRRYTNIDASGTTTKTARDDLCRGCGVVPLTWADQRKQFGRMMRAGLSKEQAGANSPRCGKCVTELLSRR